MYEDGVIDYKGIKSFMLGASNTGINGFEYGYDEQAQAPWVWNRTTGDLITFDDERSVKAKGAYVRSLGLAGLFSWEIDADNGDILNAMHEGLADGTTPPLNRAPVADAGGSQIIEGAGRVTLDGSASRDSDGQIVSYQWQQVSGTSVILSNASSAAASFEVSAIEQESQLVFDLTVVDDQGASDTDTVVVILTPITTEPTNTPPVAHLTAPTLVEAGTSVVVDASGSTDVDGDALAYSWLLPPGVNASLNGALVTFIAPEYTQDTTLTIGVEVSDGQAVSSRTVDITVKAASTGGAPCDNLWDADKVYTGGDQVTWANQVWEAKWWTRGEDPSQSGQWGVWKLVSDASCVTQ
ncbi:chitinase [Vibrio astriarenae]|nr:chitinase [Vibrio sp. C7]